MDLTRSLVDILSDNRFHSGQALASHFNVTRAAIWKAIRKLVKQGFSINAITGRGYQLSEKIEFLDINLIKDQLTEATKNELSEFYLFDQLDSTNTYLQDIDAKKGSVCLAERQTQGKGRLGRTWISPYAKNIALSLSWQLKAENHSLSGLSLIIGMAVADALRSLGYEDVGVKWPNDLVVGQKKLGGILIEMKGELSTDYQMVIGVGLNVRHSADLGKIEQACTALDHVKSGACSRNTLVATLLNQIVSTLEVFEREGFGVFLPKWKHYDVLKNRYIAIKTGQTHKYGMAVGINASGSLNVEFENGILSFHSGEVSIREV